MVDEHAHPHATFLGGEEGIPEYFGGFVVGGDVELEVNVPLGFVDFLRHDAHGFVVVVMQGEGVSADEGERTELVVELAGDQGCFVEPVGVGELWGAAGGLADQVVHGVLPGSPVLRKVRGPENQEG